MGLTNLFKLEKLKITAYPDRRRSGRSLGDFTVMFNPTSFSVKHEHVFQCHQGSNTSTKRALYSYSRPQEINLDLVIDGTGVGDFGITTLVGLGTKSVKEQVQDFLELCFYMDEELHEPKFLTLEWDALDNFAGRLKSVDITYNLLDRNGEPLRAELATVFVADLALEKRVRKEGKASPDVTHTRIVRGGDTLPLLTKEVYGSSSHYLKVAEANGLDDFRNLRPGQRLLFPPLEGSSKGETR